MGIFTPDLIVIGWETDRQSISEKKQCLRSMVNLLADRGVAVQQDKIFDKLMEREEIMSTGIGNKIAIPHIRDDAIRFFKAVIYLLDKEIDFNSIDGKKVRLIICFAVPKDSGASYMKLLSKVSEFLRNPANRSQVFNEKTKEGIYNVFRRLEDEIQS